MTNIFPNLLLFKSYCRYCISTCPKFLTIKISLPSPKLPCYRYRTLPLYISIISATENFGGILMSICTWSCTICPSSILHPFCLAMSWNTGPRNFLIFPYSSFLRHFGMNTTWYLQSHLEWLILSYDILFPPLGYTAKLSPLLKGGFFYNWI